MRFQTAITLTFLGSLGLASATNSCACTGSCLIRPGGCSCAPNQSEDCYIEIKSHPDVTPAVEARGTRVECEFNDLDWFCHCSTTSQICSLHSATKAMSCYGVGCEGEEKGGVVTFSSSDHEGVPQALGATCTNPATGPATCKCTSDGFKCFGSSVGTVVKDVTTHKCEVDEACQATCTSLGSDAVCSCTRHSCSPCTCENGETPTPKPHQETTEDSSTSETSTMMDASSSSTDTGSTDTGSTDTGSTDTGSTDTGSTDTGSTDTGSTDRGSTDTETLGTEATGTGSTGTGTAGGARTTVVGVTSLAVVVAGLV
eukprot:GHVN01029561.1.p1 GENE.GHVN01029561.1~~GHVN01029561.1.p1  ORF type:complete len:314 (-),score=17.54 GHVN01029561.1:333-1274(-)